MGKFNEWISVTRARLKAGPSHPLDILTSIATFGVGGFFMLVVISNIPWGKIFGKKKEEEDDEDEEEDKDEDSNNEEDVAHKKSERKLQFRRLVICAVHLFFTVLYKLRLCSSVQ